MSVDRHGLALRLDVLGPLEVHAQGGPVDVRGTRRRALLVLLALASGRTMTAGRLVDVLWPEEPPEHAARALHSQVSRLRADLGPLAARLLRVQAGYRLVLEADELDVDAARRLADAVEVSGRDPWTTRLKAQAALQLWRGGALEEFAAFPALEAQSVGLEELRLRLVDDLLEARLALGEASVAVAATEAAATSPLRERTTLLLVRALAAEGRAAEAMAVAQHFRRRTVDESGLDPSAALLELEQQVAAGLVSATRESGVAGSVGAGGQVAVRAPVRPGAPMVGRSHDREQLLRLLRDHPVLTVTGPGGVGKTTLALDVAADPEAGAGDEVVVVDLAAVERPERVSQSVASTLGLRTVGTPGADAVAQGLIDRALLLLLDNCEHVLEACRDLVVAVRSWAPQVRVLATSRVTLQVAGEHVVRLQPLPVPLSTVGLQALGRQPGVQAFLEHARRRRPDFALTETDAEDVVEVLRRLDGLPLGIELAARQVALMPVSAVRARLDRALDLATGRTGPAQDRQRTLRATIAASFQLLDTEGRDVLLSLAPFPGVVELTTFEALAAEVAPGADPLDLLHQVVDASLLVADASAGHYRLLFTVRSYLLDELGRRGAGPEAERRFLDHCLRVAQEIGTAGAGTGEPAADERLRGQLDNFRAARDAASPHERTDVRVGITLAVSDLMAWRDIRELWAWALELADDPELQRHPDRVEILGCAAEAARLGGDLSRAAQLADEALELAGPDFEGPEVRWALAARGAVAHFTGDFVRASDDWARAHRGGSGASGALLASAALASAYGGDQDTARRLLVAAHEVNRRSGVPSAIALAAYVEGELVATEDPAAAVPSYHRAIEGARHSGASYFEGVARVALASARTRSGDLVGAAAEFLSLIDFWTRTGHTTQLWTTARNAAAVLLQVGHARTAAMVLVCADQQPAAAAVSPAIARHSGRVFVPLGEILEPTEEEELRLETARLGPHAVLDRAREGLREVSRPDR
jgi:predicted ATPase/DNA-binding SARP family transcriptional activator